jgi:hypothetical protein
MNVSSGAQACLEEAPGPDVDVCVKEAGHCVLGIGVIHGRNPMKWFKLIQLRGITGAHPSQKRVTNTGQDSEIIILSATHQSYA